MTIGLLLSGARSTAVRIDVALGLLFLFFVHRVLVRPIGKRHCHPGASYQGSDAVRVCRRHYSDLVRAMVDLDLEPRATKRKRDGVRSIDHSCRASPRPDAHIRPGMVRSARADPRKVWSRRNPSRHRTLRSWWVSWRSMPDSDRGAA